MSDYFHTMENEYNKLMGQVTQKLNKLPTQPKETIDSLISEMKRELNDAEQCIKQMEIEVNPLPVNQRRDFQLKVRQCKTDFDDVKRKLRDIEDEHSVQKQRDNLFGSQNDKENSSKFLQADSLLASQNRRLEEGKKTAYESLGVAVNINTNLRGQSETMRRNINRLEETNEELSWSNKLIDQMNRRMRQNKILMWSVFGVIGLALVGILLSYF